MRFIFTLFLCGITLFVLSAQCPITVDLDDPTPLCGAGSVVLNAQVNGNFLDFEWSPTTELTNANQLNPTANVSATTDYTIRVRAITGAELITNGDFSQGDTGFTSDYIPGTGGGVGLLSNEGQYAIDDNAGDTHNAFANCSDNTGGGNMMVINASGDASNIWCQDITVNPATSYSFSAWVTSVFPDNPAQLQFSVNGLLLGQPYNATSNTCSWQAFAAEWTSGVNTTATICIANTNFNPFGNDFAIDDISFREICIEEATANVVVSTISAAFTVPNTLCALAGTVDPNTFLDAAATPGGFWELDGNFITTFVPADLANGSHNLTYSISDGTCQDDDTQSFSLALPPFPGAPDAFTECYDLGSTINIDLDDFMTGGINGGTWAYLSGPTNGTVNAMNGQFSTTEEGTYQYTYTVTGGAICPDISATLNFELFENPIADLPATVSLDCIIEDIELSGGNTTVGNNILYNWFQDDILLVDEFQRTLDVTEAGEYRLVVIDEDTGCTDEVTSTVLSLVDDVSFDLVTIPAACEDENSGAIQLQNIAGGTPPYLASIDGQTFSPVTDFLSLAPGNYSITVQDAGGCEQIEDTNLSAPLQPELILQSSAANNTVNLGESVTLSVISNPPLTNMDTLFWSPTLADSLQISAKQWAFVPTASTNYILTVIDENGCLTTADLQLIVRPEGNVFIPNAFSPNEDGTNDRFLLFDAGSIASINSFQIFDRWGALVYSRADVLPNVTSEGWDGRFKGQLMPAGTYIYSAEVRWISGETGQLQGEINLVY